jgi:hypothetical protein
VRRVLVLDCARASEALPFLSDERDVPLRWSLALCMCVNSYFGTKPQTTHAATYLTEIVGPIAIRLVRIIRHFQFFHLTSVCGQT